MGPSQECFNTQHLGVTVTPDGQQDTHIKHVITQGNARVLQMGRLLRRQAPTLNPKHDNLPPSRGGRIQ